MQESDDSVKRRSYFENQHKQYYPLLEKRAIVYHLKSVDGRSTREPIGVLYGEYETLKKNNLWIQESSICSSIEVVPKKSLYDLFSDEKFVDEHLYGNKYMWDQRRGENEIAFCGEDENVYRLKGTASVIIIGRPLIKTPGLPNAKTLDRNNYMHIQGICVIIVRNDSVIVECISGKMNIQSREPQPYPNAAPLSFKTEPEIHKYLSSIAPNSSENNKQESTIAVVDSDPASIIRHRLLKLCQRIEGYDVVAVNDNNLRVAQSWNELVI